MKIQIATLFLCCGVAAAQSSNPLTENFMTRYQAIKLNLVETAQAMPEENYNFKLTPGQRTFGEWIGHTAMGNYGYCATMKGEKTPPTSTIHEMNAKADLVKVMQDVFAYCDGALKGMDDAKAMTAKEIGGKMVYPVHGMLALIASDNEHYGNLVGYLRSKGITPPSTARAAKK